MRKLVCRVYTRRYIDNNQHIYYLYLYLSIIFKFIHLAKYCKQVYWILGQQKFFMLLYRRVQALLRTYLNLIKKTDLYHQVYGRYFTDAHKAPYFHILFELLTKTQNSLPASLSYNISTYIICRSPSHERNARVSLVDRVMT